MLWSNVSHRYILIFMSKERVILERRFIPKGSIVIHEGDDAYSAFLIQSGMVSVYSKVGGKTVELAQLGVGEICGEMALIGEEKRNASVRALEDCNMIVITKTSFEEKIRKSDATIQAVVQMLMERIKSANSDVLSRKMSLTDLSQASNRIYENIIAASNEDDAAKIQEVLKPEMDRFLGAIDKLL